jgi:hypothetical protein
MNLYNKIKGERESHPPRTVDQWKRNCDALIFDRFGERYSFYVVHPVTHLGQMIEHEISNEHQ